MTSPRTYAEWLSLLDRFAEGDDEAIEGMKHGELSWSSVVAERWTARVADAMSARLRALTDRLQLSLDRARGDHHAVANALVDARHGIMPLRAFLAVECIPEVVRRHLLSELDRWVTTTQTSLEKSVQDVRCDQGRLSKTIRDNALTVVVHEPKEQADARGPTDGSGPLVRHRRVIIS